MISSLGRGFSLQTVSAKKRALAYPAFYEFNSLKALALILSARTHRSDEVLGTGSNGRRIKRSEVVVNLVADVIGCRLPEVS